MRRRIGVFKGHNSSIALESKNRILRVLILEVSEYNVYIINQSLTTFVQRGAGGEEVKSVSRADGESQGGKSLRLFGPITSKNSASGREEL